MIRWYRVRKTWADSKSQKGAYKILDNAKSKADLNPGFKVFDSDGKVVYEPKAAEPEVKVPFLVRVGVPDLNIRTGPVSIIQERGSSQESEHLRLWK